MPFEKLEYERSWIKPEDFKTHLSGEDAVRADLQYHPDAVADYINNKLLPTLRSPEGVAALGGDGVDNLNTRLSAMEAQIIQAQTDIKDVSLGDTPEAIRAAEFSFEVEQWENAGEFYRIWIDKSFHKRENANFGYTLRMWDNTLVRTGTWATAGTGLWYDPSSESVVLISPVAYKGSIVFFGV